MKVCLITLGCPKNIVEGENMASMMRSRGMCLTTNVKEADSVIVHTCSFIGDASDESSEVINSLKPLKDKNIINKIIVTGCMPQEHGKELEAKFPFVDSFVGTGNLGKIADIVGSGCGTYVGRPGGLLSSKAGRLLSSNLPYAYLKISEGCNHRCSFCIIPAIRGRYKSRPMEDIFREAEVLVKCGIQEIVLVAQDTTYYGKDIYGKFMLSRLILKLSKISGVKWIRILYAHPSSITGELLQVIKNTDKVCKYIDVPLQHVNRKILKAMGRPLNAGQLVERIRNTTPGIAVRTTFIVGFPGETEKDFRELYDFVKVCRFEHLGVFEYSSNPRSPCGNMRDSVPQAVKSARKKALMLLQRNIVRQSNKTYFGSVVEVVAEHKFPGKELWMGRASFQAPEVDSAVVFSGSAGLGEFHKVSISGQAGYDLTGRVM